MTANLEQIIEEEIALFPEAQKLQLISMMQRMMSGSLKIDLNEYHTIPVDPRTFLLDDFYLGLDGEVYPAILDEFIEINSGKYVEIVLTGAIGCVDKDTEYLTRKGWKPIGDYQSGEVAQYNPDGSITFIDEPEYVSYDCDELYHLKTRFGIDQQLSAEHRVVYEDKSGNLKVKPAWQVVHEHEDNANGFGGKFRTTFSVDRIGVPLTVEQMRVMAMVVADGSFTHNRTPRCYLNLKKGRKVHRASDVLSNAGIKYEVTDKKDGYTLIKFDAPIRAKNFEWAWEANTVQLTALMDEYPHWDGRSKTKGGRLPQVYTTDRKVADFLSYCGSAIGRMTTVGVDERGYADKCYVVTQSKRTKTSLKSPNPSKIERVTPVDGKKYCFHVPSGMLVLRRNGKVFVTGNTAKTTLALWATAYQLYLVSCLHNPQKCYGLDKSSEILFIFQSINAQLAKDLDYGRFRALIEQSPYFNKHFPFEKHLESELKFPHRVIVRPVSGSDTAAIGQNVMGGVIDELNYMQVTNNSKQADGEVYDQAVAVYNSIARRRKSRFMKGGHVAGLLCLVSSRKYPGQFTDKKEAEAKKDKTIYVYDKCTWDIKPEGTFTGDWFRVFIGDQTRKPRIIPEDEDWRKTYKAHELSMVRRIPCEYRMEFETDMVNALREIAGVATLASHPFIMNTDAISPCFRPEVKSIFVEDVVDFVDIPLHLNKSAMVNLHEPRFVHLDLSQTGDKTGLVIGHVPSFVSIDRGDAQEVHPVVRIDGALAVRAPSGGEILYWKIRTLLYRLRELGMNIKWITFDSFNSYDSKQILSQKGFMTGVQSVDTTTMPYEMVKSAIYDGRLISPEHDLLQMELARLEKDTKADKIDHPPNFSKDVADGLAGVLYGLTMRREIWVDKGINPENVAPSLTAMMKKSQEKVKATTHKEAGYIYEQ